MRLVIQRVRQGQVDVCGKIVGSIETGFVILAGFGLNDTLQLPEESIWPLLIEKVATLRVFPDTAGKMNLGLEETGGHILLIPQFTLYADIRKGRRPSFHLSAPPQVAEPLFLRLIEDFEKRLPGRLQAGVFGADMNITLVNWGPVTVFLDSADFKTRQG